MQIFIPLLLGIILGYVLRRLGKRPNLSGITSAVLLIMIFLLGTKTGEVQVDSFWLLSVSLVFAILTSAGSLLMVVKA
ncbi:membrane protein [Thermococcus guaymasensis DSM 11113]|uniref:Membrane protein n=1 Tax=Thermococcus guaymasensis DSM 11113 TaxID=1432656 RepID=A0A0X1KLF9_9EURY|nr:hypothetical protein [Thermococcus guaymasensis]AJC72087.1 membrane protein [Thermococcus guaymasensis DSM 11113]